jgi:NAD(P)-dependent dehydrogenase (short-subunit alcohol dehydrogenase family)
VPNYLSDLFSLSGKTAIITGGTGVLGSAMAVGLARAGAKVAVLGRRQAQADQVVSEIEAAGGIGLALSADVTQHDTLTAARDQLLKAWGQIDILINAAGGNVPAATVGPTGKFFDVPESAFGNVIGLNLTGTVLPSQVFGAVMADQRNGCVINVSSMAAQRALTRVVAYGAAKAAVDNFTRWLAVELAQKYGAGLRVNAIAPGFFIGEQNRALLLNPDGSLTARGQTIINNTPAAQFGVPDDLLGAVIWLCSPAARFVTGTVIAIDGGFSAFSGV